MSLGPVFDSHVLRYVGERIYTSDAMFFVNSQRAYQLSILTAHIVYGDSDAVNNEIVHALIGSRRTSAYDVLLAWHIITIAQTLQASLSIKSTLHKHSRLERITLEEVLSAIRQSIAFVNELSYALVLQHLFNQSGDVLRRVSALVFTVN